MDFKKEILTDPEFAWVKQALEAKELHTVECWELATSGDSFFRNLAKAKYMQANRQLTSLSKLVALLGKTMSMLGQSMPVSMENICLDQEALRKKKEACRKFAEEILRREGDCEAQVLRLSCRKCPIQETCEGGDTCNDIKRKAEEYLKDGE